MSVKEMPDRGFVISFTDITVEHEASATLAQMNERLEKGVRDRTIELNEALKEAERANASKTRFVAAASHDLLQPLSAAKLFLSSVADHLPEGEGLTSLARAETALLSVEKIIEALLDISRLDAGQATFRVQPVQLSAILGPLADQLAPLAAEKRLRFEVTQQMASVKSDPGYLRRILQNLMSNAIKYTVSGSVRVWTETMPPRIRVVVEDTGPGIPAADQKRIFQEFERRDQDAGTPGLGLGLAIVERACIGLGHRLTLESVPGQGSRFVVELDSAPVPAPPEVAPRGRIRRAGQSLDGVIVLLVENDAELRGAMTQMLEGLHGEVLSVATAEEALTLLREIELAPDLLLVDYQLGAGLNGLDLWHRITEDYGSIPAAIVSANRSDDLRRACARIGVPLLSKPVAPEDLLNALDLMGT